MHKRLKNTLYYCIGIILFTILLQIISMLVNNDLFYPNVLEIIKAFGKLLVTGKTYLYILNTLLELIITIVFSFIFGVLLAIIASRHIAIYKILKPIMIIFRCLPIIIFFILLMVALKLKIVATVSTILVLVPLVYEATYQGLISIDRDMLDVYKMNSKLTPRVIFNVHLPLVSSHSKEAYINSIGMAIKILITTEYLSGNNNVIGDAIINSMNALNYADIFAYSFILVILVIILELIPSLIHFIFIKIKTKRDNNFIDYMLSIKR